MPIPPDRNRASQISSCTLRFSIFLFQSRSCQKPTEVACCLAWSKESLKYDLIRLSWDLEWTDHASRRSTDAMYPLLLCSIVGILLVHVLRIALKPGIAGIPGPFFAKFTNLWRLYKVWNWTYIQDLPALHEYYNSQFIRVGPNLLSCSDPRAVEIIYGFQSQFKKVSTQTLAMEHAKI